MNRDEALIVISDIADYLETLSHQFNYDVSIEQDHATEQLRRSIELFFEALTVLGLNKNVRLVSIYIDIKNYAYKGLDMDFFQAKRLLGFVWGFFTYELDRQVTDVERNSLNDENN